ncbi:MAG: ABC transporter ATP-binding protein [Defluviitaleaceae bacterium]|nr:ABC transporter ATP-binding protein [Defluviitaleaceae bacterium]
MTFSRSIYRVLIAIKANCRGKTILDCTRNNSSRFAICLELERETIITVSDMTKKFGRKIILSDINLKINQGDAIAFLGRNGCGKSTFLKIVAGLMPFEKGKVTYCKKLKFGYVPERFPAMNLTMKDYISQIGRVLGLQKEDVNERSKQLFEELFMQDMIDTPIRYLSKGTLQKMAVVQAFLTTPDVLLLDEPISGQDITSQQVFIEKVNHLNHELGVTILCSCHEDYMVKAIAKSVYEISDGKLCQIKHTGRSEFDNLCKLLFVKKSEYKNDDILAIPQSVQSISVKPEQYEGREVAIYVLPSESDRVIRDMLHENFELRGLNDERLF